jgi:nucleotide-binding universal stress UspA family protein
MAFKTILTIAAPDTPWRGDLELVSGLCEQAGAHLSVLAMTLAAPLPVGDYNSAFVPDGWVHERERDLERLEACRREIAGVLAQGVVPGDVVTGYPEISWADEMVGRRARYADLTLVGPALPDGHPLRQQAIEGVLFWSGKPLLLVPAGMRPTLAPERVLVAWDARIEAMRAVREALDLLAAAREVRLVLVDPAKGERFHGDEPGADAATFLARHGVRVTVDRLPAEGHTVAEVLRRHAVDTNAELLVMGAYGHSRLRQRILGGVTRSVLEDPPMPVFLAR